MTLPIQGISFPIDIIVRGLDKARSDIASVQASADRAGGMNFNTPTGRGGGKSTSSTVSPNMWDLQGGSGAMSQRSLNVEGPNPTYAQANMRATLLGNATAGRLAEQASIYQAAKERHETFVRTGMNPGDVFTSRYGIKPGASGREGDGYVSAGDRVPLEANGASYAGTGYGKGGKRPGETIDPVSEMMTNMAAQRIAGGGSPTGHNQSGSYESQDIGGLRSSILDGNKGEMSGDKDAGKAAPWYQKKMQIRNLLRYTLGGIVTDIFALELGNEANYKKAITLAGMDQHAQAGAELGRFTGGLRAVPILGPALTGLASPLTSQIETQLELSQRQNTTTDLTFGHSMESAMLGQRTVSMRQGSGSYEQRLGGIRTRRQEAMTTQMAKQHEEEKAFDADHSLTTSAWSVNQDFMDFVFGGTAIGDIKRHTASDKQYEVNQEREAKNHDLAKQLATVRDSSSEEETQLGREYALQIGMSRAGTAEAELTAGKKPLSGRLARLFGEEQATLANYNSGGRGAESKEIELDSLKRSIAEVTMVFNDARDKLLFGKTIDFNPAMESADKFQSPYSMELVAVMQEAVTHLASIRADTSDVKNGNPR